MKLLSTTLLTLAMFTLGGCASMKTGNPTISVLLDLDPASVDRTVIIEN